MEVATPWGAYALSPDVACAVPPEAGHVSAALLLLGFTSCVFSFRL